MMRFAEIAAPFFDTAEIIELHHDGKADAPSGTALATAERMAAASADVGAPTRRRDEVVAGARGGVGPAGIRVHSVRMRGMVAHQEVILGALGQTLTIRQDSYDRASFMPGVAPGLQAHRRPPRPDGRPRRPPRPVTSACLDRVQNVASDHDAPAGCGQVDAVASVDVLGRPRSSEPVRAGVRARSRAVSCSTVPRARSSVRRRVPEDEARLLGQVPSTTTLLGSPSRPRCQFEALRAVAPSSPSPAQDWLRRREACESLAVIAVPRASDPSVPSRDGPRAAATAGLRSARLRSSRTWRHRRARRRSPQHAVPRGQSSPPAWDASESYRR